MTCHFCIDFQHLESLHAVLQNKRDVIQWPEKLFVHQCGAEQVHPDKCQCFGAEQAFQILSEAVNNIMGSAEGGFVKDAQAEQHVWWEKWDLDPSSAKRKRRRDEDIVPQVDSISAKATCEACIFSVCLPKN